MNEMRAWVRMFLAEHQGPGQWRTRCPACGGGSGRETSMVITQDAPDSARWICHRASCSNHGAVGVTPSAAVFEKAERLRTKIKPYWGELHPLDSEDLAYFDQRFGIPEELAVAWIRHNGEAYVLPIYNRYGQVRGHVERQPVWKGRIQAPRHGVEGKPKASTWPSKDEPMQSWYYGDEADTVVLVEDQVSAIKAAAYGYTGLALLGTHLNAERVREIQQERPRRVLLALDHDAGGIALKLAQKWAIALPGFELRLLRADLKDTPDPWEELQ